MRLVTYWYSVSLAFASSLFMAVFFRICMRCHVFEPLTRFKRKDVTTENIELPFPFTCIERYC